MIFIDIRDQYFTSQIKYFAFTGIFAHIQVTNFQALNSFTLKRTEKFQELTCCLVSAKTRNCGITLPDSNILGLPVLRRMRALA